MKLHMCQLCSITWEDNGEPIAFCYRCEEAFVVCCECETHEDQDNCEVCQEYLWHEAWQRCYA